MSDCIDDKDRFIGIILKDMYKIGNLLDCGENGMIYDIDSIHINSETVCK